MTVIAVSSCLKTRQWRKNDAAGDGTASVEYCVVINGVAEALNGEKKIALNENESTYTPLGATYSLRNVSDEAFLEIIEIQTGSYLGEDDIMRFEVNYGRS